MAKVEDGHQPFVESTKPLHNSIPDHLAPNFEPAFLEYYNKYNAGRLATHQVPMEKFRADPNKYTITYGRDRVSNDGVKWSDLKCPVDDGGEEVTARVFEPVWSSTDKLRPVYINYHSGGWVFGGLASDFDFGKRIVRELDCVVFDVDYRLSPEYKFPIHVEDSIAAFNWNTKAEEHDIDLSRVAIGGTSAGGQSSAVVGQVCRDAGIFHSRLQVLAVARHRPPRLSPPKDRSEKINLRRRARKFADNQPFIPGEEGVVSQTVSRLTQTGETWRTWRTNGKVSPMLAPNFTDLAPALILTAEMDVLRDQGEAYAAKMKRAGCTVELVRFKGAPHYFYATTRR